MMDILVVYVMFLIFCEIENNINWTYFLRKKN